MYILRGHIDIENIQKDNNPAKLIFQPCLMMSLTFGYVVISVADPG